MVAKYQIEALLLLLITCHAFAAPERLVKRVAPPTTTKPNQQAGIDGLDFPTGSDTQEVRVPPPTGPNDDSEILKITAKASSQLFISPGSTGNIFLTVKNTGTVYSIFSFTTNSAYVSARPSQAPLNAGEEIEIQLIASIPFSIQQGSTVPVNFFARRSDNAYASRNILIQTRNEPLDKTAPNSRLLTADKCGAFLNTNCGGKSWLAVLEIGDTEAGLRTIEVKPELQFNGGSFVIGSNKTSILSLEVSCCQSKVEIISTDLKGNQKSLIVDQNALDGEVKLGSGDIAAITLGVIILILIIIATVIWVIRSRKRKAFKAVLKISRERKEDSTLMER